jgi:hypothetical protein
VAKRLIEASSVFFAFHLAEAERFSPALSQIPALGLLAVVRVER